MFSFVQVLTTIALCDNDNWQPPSFVMTIRFHCWNYCIWYFVLAKRFLNLKKYKLQILDVKIEQGRSRWRVVGNNIVSSAHTYYTQIMINWFFIYSFVEKFNFLIYKLFILGLQSHCLFCKAELILKIVETHIDEWQPWDLANNECLVTIFCSSIQSIIKNKTNNKSMYGNIVGGIDLLSTNKTTARSDKLSGSNSWAALAVMLI